MDNYLPNSSPSFSLSEPGFCSEWKSLHFGEHRPVPQAQEMSPNWLHGIPIAFQLPCISDWLRVGI